MKNKYEKTKNKLEKENVIPSTFEASSMDKLTFALRKFGDQQIHAILDFDGHFDVDRLKIATRLLIDEEPVLGCIFVEDKKKPYWKRMENLDEQDYCSFIVSKNFNEEIFDYIVTPNDPRKELAVKVRIFQRNGFDTFCVKTSHALLDGGGLQEYVVKLGRIYRELEKNPKLTVDSNINGRRSLKQVLEKFNFFKKVFIFFKNMSSKPNWAFPWVGTTPEKPNYILSRYSSEEFKKIKEFAKKNDATINDITLTAFYRAVFEILKNNHKEKLVTVVTINLRAYMPNYKAESLCNLSSSSYPEINFKENESFIDTLTRVKKEMEKRKKFAPGVGPAVFIENVFKMNFSKVKKSIQRRFEKDLKRDATHPVFTNVGLIKTSDFNFGNIKPIDGYLMTPIMNAPGLIVGLMTFNDKMSFCMGFYEESYDKTVVEKFFSLIRKELEICFKQKIEE